MQKDSIIENLEKLDGEKISIDKERLIRIAGESPELKKVIHLLCSELKIEKKKETGGRNIKDIKGFLWENEGMINTLFRRYFGCEFEVRSGGDYVYQGFYIADVDKWEIIKDGNKNGVIVYKGS